MIFGVTGHRDLDQQPGELRWFARLLVTAMVQRGCTEIITGMARGFDLAIAQACADSGVPFIAAIPFIQQPLNWEQADRTDWERLTREAKEVYLAGPYPQNTFYFARNKWIVDHSEQLWSLYDGRGHGGTQHCTLYAEQQKRIVKPLWDEWIRFRAERN